MRELSVPESHAVVLQRALRVVQLLAGEAEALESRHDAAHVLQSAHTKLLEYGAGI